MKRHLQLQATIQTHHSARVSLPAAVVTTSILTLLLAACQGAEPRDLGFTQNEQNLARDVEEPFYTAGDEFVGRWIGEAEEPLALTDDGTTPVYRFPSGSSQFVLDIRPGSDANGDPTLVGHITFGAGAPLAPATDPDVGYPVGFSYVDALTYDPDSLLGNPGFGLPPFEGFDYSFVMENYVGGIDGVQLPDGVLNLTYGTNEPLGSWCALQTPFSNERTPDLYTCQDFGGASSFEVNPDGTGASCELSPEPDTSNCPENPTIDEFTECSEFPPSVVSVNCDKLFLCGVGFCECDSVACHERGAAGTDGVDARRSLTVRRSGDEIIGVFDGTTFVNARNLKVPLGEVRFQRVE
jgi:hypothetical protein